jgi:hypothetical protein
VVLFVPQSMHTFRGSRSGQCALYSLIQAHQCRCTAGTIAKSANGFRYFAIGVDRRLATVKQSTIRPHDRRCIKVLVSRKRTSGNSLVIRKIDTYSSTQ